MEKTKMKFSTRCVAVLLTVLTLVGALPLSTIKVSANDSVSDGYLTDEYPIVTMANPGSATPSVAMLDNVFLDALAGTGYKVDTQRNNSTLFVQGYYASNTPSDILTGIPYAAVSRLDVTRTRDAVSGEETATGQVPDIDYIKSRGMECGGYVSYVFMNYLPNVKGITYEGLDDYPDSLPTHSPATWWETLEKLVKAGKAERIQIGVPDESLLGNLDTSTKADITYVDWNKVEIGDIIIFGTSEEITWSSIKHIGIYAGTCYNGWITAHFMTHVGNSRGPEITEVRYMADSGSKSSIPVAIYRLKPANNPGKIQIIKKSTNGGRVDGWQFTVYSNEAFTDAYKVDTYTTDENGIITTGDLTPGTYYVKETGYPSNMSDEEKAFWNALPTSYKTVEVKAGETAEVTFTNYYSSSIKIIKTATNGGRVDGWQFQIYRDASCEPRFSIGEILISGADGTITNTRTLTPGTYYIKETGYPSDMTAEEKAKWILDDSVKEISIESGQVAEVTFTNNYDSGNIKIIKTATNGGTVNGWKFRIYRDEACTQQAVSGTYFTGSDGTINVRNIPSGEYWVKEVGYEEDNVIPDYWLCLSDNPHKVTVTLGETATVTFENAWGGKVEIVKTVTNDGGTVEGWKFTIYSDQACTTVAALLDGTAAENLVTDADGVIVTEGLLDPGTYYVKEVGYPDSMTEEEKAYWSALPADAQPVVVTAGKTATVTFENSVYGKAKITKTSTNGGTVEGWQFTVYKDDKTTVVGTYTTGADGTFTVDNLDPGTYYVQETDYPSDLTDEQKEYWKLDTALKAVTVNIQETAAVAFENEYFGKAEITKVSTNGGTVEGWEFTVYKDRNCTDVVGVYTTGDDGTFIVDELEPGTYYVKETGMPDGVDPTYWAMDTSTRTVTVEAGKTGTATFTNQYEGNLKIIKTTTNGGTVEGWQFAVYAAASDEEIAPAITIYISDENGVFTTDILMPGTYYVQEVGYPADMTEEEKAYWVLDASVKTVVVEAGSTSVVTFENNWLGNIEIVKTATNGGTVEGWEFTVYSDSDCTTVVGIYTTDRDGIIATDMLDPGTYFVKETGYPEGESSYYWAELPTDAAEVTVTAGETASVSFENRWYGRAEIVKTLANPEAGTLDGWTVEVRDSDGNIVGTYVTDENGMITTDKLEPGTYIVTEILAEDSIWFCVSENPQTVTVTAGQTASVSFENALHPGKITVEKTDNNGMILEGATFLLEWSEDGVTWQPVSFTDTEIAVVGGCTSEGLVDGTLTVGADGVVVFEGLYPLIYYRLTETAAPNGYQLLTVPVFEGKLEIEAEFEAAFRVVNHPLSTLPVTGSSELTHLPYIAMAAATIGLVLIRLKKRKKNTV